MNRLSRHDACECFTAIVIAHGDHAAAMMALREGGLSVNDSLNHRKHKDFFPLTLAVEYAHIGVVQALLAAGANVNLRNGEEHRNTPNQTALHLVADSWRVANSDKQCELARILLGAGADRSIPDGRGMTAFHAALSHACYDVARLLYYAGGERARFACGETALHILARSGSNVLAVAPMLGFLCQREADINARDWNGRTPLHLVVSDNPILLDAFLAHGADPLAVDYFGCNLLHSGIGAVPQSTYPDALRAGLRRLLEAGIDPNARDHHGRTPISMARTRKLPEFAQLLRTGAVMQRLRGVTAVAQDLATGTAAPA